MGEKRKPHLVMLLRKQGRDESSKIEIFRATLWDGGRRGKYRLRVDGKWFTGNNTCYFGLYEIRDMLWRSVKGMV